MKTFVPLDFDWRRCELELREFRELLASNRILREQEQVLPFFRKRPHLSSFISTYHPDIVKRALIAYEYQLYGDFGADLVVGDDGTHSFCFIEFEDAKPSSLFSPSRRSVAQWSPRFLRGYSQVADWFWKLEDLRTTEDFVSRFGSRSAKLMGILVVGRSADLDSSQRARLDWWRRNVTIAGSSVLCCTYDELCSQLERRMVFSKFLTESPRR